MHQQHRMHQAAARAFSTSSRRACLAAAAAAAAAAAQPHRRLPRSSASDSNDQELLSWSITEDSPQQQQQQQQQQSTTRQQRRRSRNANDVAAAQPQQQQQVAGPQHSSGEGKQQRRQRTAPRTAGSGSSSGADAYRAAQQRVRQLLVSADLSAPAAAASQLPDDANDLAIALQLLATAPRPARAADFKQYSAAVCEAGAAVVDKLKRLLVQQQQQQQQGRQAGGGGSAAAHAAPDEQQQLAAAVAALPATKVAALLFSLGVLRHYDAPLVHALLDAAQALLARGSLSPNQLGQLGQGCVYLDAQLTRGWQAAYLAACRRQLRAMSAQQLASIAEFLLATRSYAGGDSSSSGGDGESGSVAAAVAVGCGGSGGGHSSSSGSMCTLESSWICAYCQAAGQQAGSMSPKQLVLVLQAAACMFQEQQQQHGSAPDDGPHTQLASVFAALPLQLPDELPRQQVFRSASRSASNCSSSGSNCSSSAAWLLALLAAFQRTLPDAKMPQLAAGLRALAALTAAPWPAQHAAPLALQLRLLLPTSAGRDIAAAVAGAAALAPPGVLADDADWADALLQRLHAVLPLLSMRDIARVVGVLAALRLRPYKAWTYELCRRLRVEGRAMEPGQAVELLEALSVLRVVLDAEVLSLFVAAQRRGMGRLSAQQLRRAAAALRRMYPRVLPGRSVQLLVEEMQRRAGLLLLQEQQAAGA